MVTLKARWQWVLLNGVALAMWVVVLTQGTAEWHGPEDGGFDSMLEGGKWGVRWLLLCLAMTPLHTYLRWSSAPKLRKSAGLWAFAFGATHFMLYARETWEPVAAFRTGGTPWHWLTWPMPLYVALGLLAMTILTALAVTSNRWAMRHLGKQWKRLHRLVYGAGVAVCAHALLAATMSKKMAVRDPQAVPELQLYLGVLVVLLIIRLPQVRRLSAKRTVAVARAAHQVASRNIPGVEPVTPRLVPLLPRPTDRFTLDEAAGVGVVTELRAPNGEDQPHAPESVPAPARELVN